MFKHKRESKNELDSPAFLCECSTDFEGTVIAKLLESNGIPVEMVPNGAGGYLQIIKGANDLGVNLFVPSRALQIAKDILNAEIEEELS